MHVYHTYVLLLHVAFTCFIYLSYLHVRILHAYLHSPLSVSTCTSLEDQHRHKKINSVVKLPDIFIYVQYDYQSVINNSYLQS